jgi:hypothetical protein
MKNKKHLSIMVNISWKVGIGGGSCQILKLDITRTKRFFQVQFIVLFLFIFHFLILKIWRNLTKKKRKRKITQIFN